MLRYNDILKVEIRRRSNLFFVLYSSFFAFATYSCMYAFRKPFTVAEFTGYSFLNIDYKIWLISAQIIGYTISKFIGIKIIAELKPSQRIATILLLIGIAEAGLLLFYLLPVPFSILGMLINGLPLGIIWGVVFSYLEGRRYTELLGAGLSASFIIASGVVKSVGKFLLLKTQISEFAMPFVVGLIFTIPLLVSVFFLDAIPAPSSADEKARTKRVPMDKNQRKLFLREFYYGIILFIVTYTLLTVFREIRDNFSNEIWNALGQAENPAIFTLSEIPVAFITLISLALISFIKSNIKAFIMIESFILAGFILIFCASFLFSMQLISGINWMIITGIGLYLGYVPFNAFLYERLISAFCITGNVGFIMYLSDSFGYLGSMGVIFTKNFLSPELSWIDFFIHSGIWLSLAGMVFMIMAIIHFNFKYQQLNLIQFNGYKY